MSKVATMYHNVSYILVLYYSRYGSTASLAQEIADGIASHGTEVLMRCVPPVSNNVEKTIDAIPESGAPYVTVEEFANCSGLALGSPGRFGNMAAAMKFFLEQTTAEWVSGKMVGKPATLFTSTTTEHGGQESTLLSMMNPLLHHGMLIAGVPYTEPGLHQSIGGGSPYGLSHVAGPVHAPLTPKLAELARHQGKRLAQLATRLQND